MNILILDNCMEEAQALKGLLASGVDPPQVFLCANTSVAARAADARRMDIFILSAPSDPGLEFAGRIRGIERYKMTWLIFLAADDSLVFRAFNEFHCYHYIVRPYDLAAFAERVKALTRYEIVQTAEGKPLMLQDKGSRYLIPLHTIRYLEAGSKSLRIVTDKSTYRLSRISLSSIAAQLPADIFLQCHRSFVFNRNLLKRIDTANHLLYLEPDGIALPIGSKFLGRLSGLLA